MIWDLLADKIHAQLSWAWKKFYNLGSRAQHFLQDCMYIQRRLRQACTSRTLIRVIALRLKMLWNLGYPRSALRRFWSDCADAQADLSLRWAHIQSCEKGCVSTHITVHQIIRKVVSNVLNSRKATKTIQSPKVIYYIQCVDNAANEEDK